MSKNKAVTTKPRTGGNEKLLFHFVGWKGGKWIPTNSNGFQREHDLDPQQGLKQRWCFPASGMKPDCSGRWDREVMVVSKVKEKHGMQWSRGLALSHTDYDSVLGKSPVGTGSSASQWETKCPAWRAMVLLFCPPQRGKPGVALAKITKGKEGGLAVAERLSGNCSMCFAYCTGNYAQDNNQLKLGFGHMKPTADPN